jgi:hypothetical protein
MHAEADLIFRNGEPVSVEVFDRGLILNGEEIVHPTEAGGFDLVICRNEGSVFAVVSYRGLRSNWEETVYCTGTEGFDLRGGALCCGSWIVLTSSPSDEERDEYESSMSDSSDLTEQSEVNSDDSESV